MTGVPREERKRAARQRVVMRAAHRRRARSPFMSIIAGSGTSFPSASSRLAARSFCVSSATTTTTATRLYPSNSLNLRRWADGYTFVCYIANTPIPDRDRVQNKNIIIHRVPLASRGRTPRQAQLRSRVQRVFVFHYPYRIDRVPDDMSTKKRFNLKGHTHIRKALFLSTF